MLSGEDVVVWALGLLWGVWADWRWQEVFNITRRKPFVAADMGWSGAAVLVTGADTFMARYDYHTNILGKNKRVSFHSFAGVWVRIAHMYNAIIQ